MPRASKNRLSGTELEKLEKDFFQMLSSTDSLPEVLKDLFTEEEIVMLYKRVGIYVAIEKGDSDKEIIDELNVSYETVRIHKIRYQIKNGAFKKAVRGLISTKRRENLARGLGKTIIDTFSVSDIMKKKPFQG